MSEVLAGCLPDLVVKFRCEPGQVVWLAEPGPALPPRRVQPPGRAPESKFPSGWWAQ